MSPLQAAFRLYTSTPPDRIHTHRQEPLPERIQGKHLGFVPDGLIEEVKRFVDNGASRETICRELRMGDRLYRRIRTIMDERIQATMPVEARRAQIKELRDGGMSTRRMMSITGLSRTTIQKYVRSIRASDDRYKDIPTL